MKTPPAAVQRAAARRQELPVHRDQPRRGVPARLLHARGATGATGSTSGRSRTPTRCGTPSTSSARSSRAVPCEGREPGRPSGVPCLDYHIKRCLAPCVGYISKEDYRALIDQIIAFLSGRYRGLEKELEGEMREAAAGQEFERAASLRNRLQAMRHLMERQFATAGSVGTADVLGVALEGDTANVQVLQVRDGVVQDRQSFFLDAAGAEDEATVLVQFAYEYYALALAIPPRVIVGAGERGGRRPRGAAHRPQGQPRRGARRRPGRQAQDGRAGGRATPASPWSRTCAATSRRAPAAATRSPTSRPSLDLPAPPVRIECLRHLEPRRDLRGRLDGGVRGGRAGQGPLPHLHDARRRRPRRLRAHGARP